LIKEVNNTNYKVKLEHIVKSPIIEDSQKIESLKNNKKKERQKVKD
jgi:hypothetical protein